MSRYAERWAASSGMAFAVVLVVSNLLPGTPPHYDASAHRIVVFLTDHHRAITVGAVLQGLALVLFLWFLASFAGLFREAGQGRLSTIVYGAGVATVAIVAVGDALTVGDMRLATFGSAA